MTTRYHSTSGVLSLNIQLTRSAGPNNPPLPQPIIPFNHQNNRQQANIILSHLRTTVVGLKSFVRNGPPPPCINLSVVSTVLVVFLLHFYTFTLVQFSCTGCLKLQLADVRVFNLLSTHN